MPTWKIVFLTNIDSLTASFSSQVIQPIHSNPFIIMLIVKKSH